MSILVLTLKLFNCVLSLMGSNQKLVGFNVVLYLTVCERIIYQILRFNFTVEAALVFSIYTNSLKTMRLVYT